MTEDQFEEHWRMVIVSLVKASPVSRCEQKRDNILKFSYSMMKLKLPHCQKRTWNLDNNDSGSSDSGATETAAEQMV